MSQLSLLVALAGLAFAPAPQDPQPEPAPAPAQDDDEKTGYGGMLGVPDPRWMARGETKKILFETGGEGLMNAWMGTWNWLSEQTPQTDALMSAEDGRGVALSAICALSMSGNGSGIRSGAQKKQFRVLTRALRALQDAESGAYVGADAPERALDQALAVHCIAEATITHPVDVMFAHNAKGVAALLALRGEDGLWHVPGKPAAQGEPAEASPAGGVDAFTTGVAAYALYTAMDAGAEIEPEVFESIARWSETAALDGADEGARAANAIGVLCARIFAHQGLGRKLADDARVDALLARLDAWLPKPADEGQPAEAGMAQRNDFAYLASVALYQADNLRWNRLYNWIAARAVAEAPDKPAENKGYPAGENGRLPAGAVATTALRMLQMQSVVREPALDVFAQ
jgi:hypothetical protein